MKKQWKRLMAVERAAIIGVAVASAPAVAFAAFLATHIQSENLTFKEEADRFVIILLAFIGTLALGALLGAAIQDWRDQRRQKAKINIPPVPNPN